MSKHTAVEWLVNQLIFKQEYEHLPNNYFLMSDKDIDSIIEQAKTMEREHIEDAYINSETAYHSTDDAKAMAKHYYEQNYGKEAGHEG